MPPSKHAILSASSSHRWLNCPPSARLELEFEDRETEAAAEGTAAHALCEHKLRRALKRQSRKPISKYDCDEMDTERDDEAYSGCYFVNANSKTAPQIVDKHVRPILDRSEVYSGVYAHVSLSFYAFNTNGNKGIACGLGNIQKVKDG